MVYQISTEEKDKIFSIAPGYCFFKRHLLEHRPQTGFFWLALDGSFFFFFFNYWSNPAALTLSLPHHTLVVQKTSDYNRELKASPPAPCKQLATACKDLACSGSQTPQMLWLLFIHVWKLQGEMPRDSCAHGSVPSSAVQWEASAWMPLNGAGETLSCHQCLYNRLIKS